MRATVRDLKKRNRKAINRIKKYKPKEVGFVWN
jgi:hypothetical protein